MKNPRLEEIQTLARYCITKSPGFAAIALWVPYHVSDDDDFVAYTDGANIVFGAKFWGYSRLEQAFVFVHEVLHVAFRHIPRAQNRAPFERARPCLEHRRRRRHQRIVA